MREPLIPDVDSQLFERLKRAFGDETARHFEARGLGRYLIEDEVGRGGMGAVLSVFDNELRRRLAMKVLLGERGVTEMARVERFLEEAQIMGQLEHPGIVPVHELGVDDRKNVYFTMRFVRGRSLGEIAERVTEGDPDWTLTRAVDVIRRACETLAYAHDHGVVHRDLKPANVMVGAYGEVYVMDWGLALVLGRDDRKGSVVSTARREAQRPGSDSGHPTLEGAVLGTPGYLSPEQASGRHGLVGPLSDVFSAGAVLYRVLTGQRPFFNESTSAAEAIARATKGPPTPVHTLAPDVPADLAAICERAMALRPEDRYPHMRAFADDLRAYLEGRVVQAYEQGAWAELRKWVLRNRALASASAAALLFLVLGLGAVGFVESRARRRAQDDNAALVRANEGARREAETSRRAVDFMTSMFTAQDPRIARGASVTVKEVLDRGAEQIVRELGDEPEIRAELLGAMGEVYTALGLMDRGEPLLAERAALARELHGADSEEALRAELMCGTTLFLQGRYEEARTLVEEVIATIRANDLEDHPLLAMALVELASLERNTAQLEQAEQHAREALRLAEHLPPEGPFGTPRYDAEELVASLLRQASRFEEAEQILRTSAERATRELGPDHARTLSTRNALATLYETLGRFPESRETREAVAQDLARIYGPYHLLTLHAVSALAVLDRSQGQPLEAVARFEEVLPAAREVLGSGHHDLLIMENSLGVAYSEVGRFDEALETLERAVRGWERGFGELHPGTAAALTNLGQVQVHVRRLDEAERSLERALEARREIYGEGHYDTAQSHNNLALCYRAQGRYEEALETFELALDSFTTVYGHAHPDTLTALDNVGVAQYYLRRPDEALATFERELELATPLLGEAHPIVCRNFSNLGATLDILGRDDEALEHLERALACREASLGSDHPDTLTSLGLIGRMHLEHGRYGEAEPIFRRCLEAHRASFGPEHDQTLNALALLGETHARSGRTDLALEELEEAVRGLAALGGPRPRHAHPALLLAGLWIEAGRRAEALELTRELDPLVPPDDPQRKVLDELLSRLGRGE